MSFSFRPLRLCGGLVMLAAAALAQAPDCSLVEGWTPQGKPRTFAPDNLFEYMDGNAEGYLIYRFVKMDGINCQSGANTLIFDVFEMTDPEWAYGVFAANRDPRVKTEKLGVAGQVVPRQTIFVKDKYFVQISSETDQADVLRRFALAFEKRLPGVERTSGRAHVVPGCEAGPGFHPPGARKRARHARAQARLRRAVRIRQGVPGAGSDARIRRRGNDQAARPHRGQPARYGGR